MQRSVRRLSTGLAGPALCLPIASPNRETACKGQTAMIKIQPRNEPQQRRLPVPDMGQDWSADKGRKHEAFDAGLYSGERRGFARALRFDRKR
jgi:hypothetical protein